MPSGGARARSGPAPDPNALRRDRATDREWITLPAEGRRGRTPRWPFETKSAAEHQLWSKLWKKPQAVQWERLELHLEVAAYVRAFLESIREGEVVDGVYVPGAPASLKTAVLRMSAELGLSTVGMHQLRWKIAVDELAERREAATTGARPSGSSARDRMKALSNA